MVRDVGAPVAGKAKLVKLVSADAPGANNPRTPTPTPAVKMRFEIWKLVLITLNSPIRIASLDATLSDCVTTGGRLKLVS
jgi:hypothetical protein